MKPFLGGQDDVARGGGAEGRPQAEDLVDDWLEHIALKVRRKKKDI